MRFHVVSLPHTQLTKDYSSCAYTQKVRKFVDMMVDRGHYVSVYAGQYNDTMSQDPVSILSVAEQKQYGFNGPEDYLKIDFDNGPYWRKFNRRVIKYMKQRVQPHDIICVITGRPTQAIKDAFPNNLFVEFGIGYEGIIPDAHHIFESQAWMNHVYGIQGIREGKFYDDVIPNYFEIDDFPISDYRGDYFLFVGRVDANKGLGIAQQVCEKLGYRLIVAGPGNFTGYGEYVGTVDPTFRGALMSQAKAVFVPTLYIPPFEGVHIEANLCGTPVITTPFGVFQETVIDYFTGIKCRDMNDFIAAAKYYNETDVDYESIRDWAQSNFSTEVIAAKYEQYFERLFELYSKNWDGSDIISSVKP